MTLQVPEDAVYWTALLRFDVGLEGRYCIRMRGILKNSKRIAHFLSVVAANFAASHNICRNDPASIFCPVALGRDIGGRLFHKIGFRLKPQIGLH